MAVYSGSRGCTRLLRREGRKRANGAGIRVGVTGLLNSRSVTELSCADESSATVGALLRRAGLSAIGDRSRGRLTVRLRLLLLCRVVERVFVVGCFGRLRLLDRVCAGVLGLRIIFELSAQVVPVTLAAIRARLRMLGRLLVFLCCLGCLACISYVV